MQLLDWLLNIDKELFVIIHSDLAAPQLDSIFLTLRNSITSVPVYIFMLFWCYRFHKKMLWKFLLVSIACFAVTDLTTARLFKPLIDRERPCFDAALADTIRGIINCGGHLSFPSSHAANHMGISTFWFFSVRLLSGRNWYWLFLWTLLICYAQIYVGKHYPLDIMAGIFFGWLVGLLMAKLFERMGSNNASNSIRKRPNLDFIPQ